MSKLGRILTKDEITFCNKKGLNQGFDSDNEEFCPVQLSHICYPYDPAWVARYELKQPIEEEGAICKTPHLWFHGRAFDLSDKEENNRVTCNDCLLKLQEVMSCN